MFNSNLHNSSPHSTKTPFAGFNTFLLTYTWEDTLVAIKRSYGKAFGLQRKMRSFWITSPNMVMDVGAQSPNLLVYLYLLSIFIYTYTYYIVSLMQRAQ